MKRKDHKLKSTKRPEIELRLARGWVGNPKDIKRGVTNGMRESIASYVQKELEHGISPASGLMSAEL